MLKVDSDEKVADWQVSSRETDIADCKAATNREGGFHEMRGRVLALLLIDSAPQRLTNEDQRPPVISARALIDF